MPRDRQCCDGGCTRGLGCPAFALGAVDGPYRRAVAAWRWPLMCLVVVIIAGTVWSLA